MIVDPKLKVYLYPKKHSAIPCAERMVITVSNYSGFSREVVKYMIKAMGAQYTGFLSEDNTLLICAK